MKKIQILFHDAGGGHRNAAVALQTIISQQNRPWQIELVQFQELTDRLDVLRKVLQATIRVFHRPMVRLLSTYFRSHPSDLLVSVIPHFNRAIGEAWTGLYPGRPFVTLITDLADLPPHFWIEAMREQYVICGTERAVKQAQGMGKENSHVFRTSGMIVRPDFYDEAEVDPNGLRRELGLRPDLKTGMLLFGGFGSKVMYKIAERLDEAGLPLQLIVICGRNEKLAAQFRARSWKMPVHVVGFTREVHRLMRAADFLIGKPGPGSVAEAMVRRLPVILECNSWTLPQERYNTEWVREQRVGIVLKSFDEIVRGVRELLEPATLTEFQGNVGALNNRAVFEIPEIFAKLLGEDGERPGDERARQGNSQF